jgi:aminoglycoside phosphotransferase (APT) family kinase protein
MQDIVRTICQKEGIAIRDLRVLSGGQVNSIFLINSEYVVRVGERDNAIPRLTHEAELLQSLAGEIPVPKIFAFGRQEGRVYQVQQYVRGQKLASVWKHLPLDLQENIGAELAHYLQILHAKVLPFFGAAWEGTRRYDTWAGFLSGQFKHTLAEIDDLNIQIAPGFLELARNYFEEYEDCLQDGVPNLLHGDLTLVNVLVDNGKISAMIDFEYSLQAPLDYELWTMEAFCLYPNDWMEEGQEVYCSADFASFFQVLKKYDPEIFAIPNLRERMNLYHLDGALGSYLAWRKDNLRTIPATKMAAKEFYMARITNFIFGHGARMF